MGNGHRRLVVVDVKRWWSHCWRGEEFIGASESLLVKEPVLMDEGKSKGGLWHLLKHLKKVAARNTVPARTPSPNKCG
jgi:hypothetical protein